jgi:hypothetical protein
MYARVANPERNVYVQIPELGFRLFSYGVRPAEMIWFKLRKDMFSKLGADVNKITLEVKPR